MHLQPVIHVAPDGQTANVRSRPFIMFGIHGVRAQWGSGVYENRFVKEDGVWKFDYLHGYWTFYTNYEDGWTRRRRADVRPVRSPTAGSAAIDTVRGLSGPVRAAVPLRESRQRPQRPLRRFAAARGGRPISGAPRASRPALAQRSLRWHSACMAIQITIRDVPEKVRDELAARAALQGKSMQEFLRSELERLAARPSIEAWLDEVRKKKKRSANASDFQGNPSASQR